MLGVPPTDVVVTADPLRGYGDVPGVLITVHDSGPVPHGGDGPPDPPRAWRSVPEVGNTGTGGGAYLLLDSCAACGAEVPMAAISTLADLGLYVEQAGPRSPDTPDPDDEDGHRPEVPIEFFDDPGHVCPAVPTRSGAASPALSEKAGDFPRSQGPTQRRPRHPPPTDPLPPTTT